MKKKLRVDRANAWRMGIDLVATGAQLKKYRILNDLTQEELSGLFEEGYDSVSRVSISLWENGKKLPSLPHLMFLRNLYSCKLDELVCGFQTSDKEAGDGDQPVVFLFAGLRARRPPQEGISSAAAFHFLGVEIRQVNRRDIVVPRDQMLY